MKLQKLFYLVLTGLILNLNIKGKAETGEPSEETNNKMTGIILKIIPVENTTLSWPCPTSPHPNGFEHKIIRNKSLCLWNPNNTKGVVVAILGFKKNGSVLLNPEITIPHASIDYSGVPPLKDMSEQMCDNLWGNGITSTGFKTYRLIGPKDKRLKVSIDVKFEDNLANKYRVSLPGKKTTDWISVQSVAKLNPEDFFPAN